MATEQQSLDSIIMPHLRLELTNEEKQRYRTTRLKDSNASLTVGQENTVKFHINQHLNFLLVI